MLGIACFIAAFAVHLITLAAIGVGASPAAVSAIGATNFVLNKVLLIASAAFLGRAGFDQLKGIIFGAFRRYAYPDQVSAFRYRLGLILLVVPIILAWVAPYVAEFAPSIGRNTVRDGLIGDVVLIIGLVMLGGDFWDKLRALFVREAKVAFPN
ncbi:MAG: hypothetical protein U1E67_23745 [Hyphomicrobiales bacterium]